MILRRLIVLVGAFAVLAAPALAADRKPLVLSPTTGQQQQLQSGDAVGAAYGGTGLNSLTAHCVLVGAGTSAAHLVCPSSSGQVLTDNGASSDPSFGAPAGCTMANPTATAADTAVNGSATTCMRSDAAPPVQKGSASAFGIVKVDGTTVTASGGVISATGAAGPIVLSPSGVASITASVSGGHNLRIVCYLRSAIAGATEGMSIEFNSDTTAADYEVTTYEGLLGGAYATGTVTSGTSGAFVGNAGGNSATAGIFSTMIIDVPNYNNSSNAKTIHAQVGISKSNAGVAQEFRTIGRWNPSTAVASITFVLASNFVSGSAIYIYVY